MAEWAKESAVTLTRAIQEKRISSSELLEYFIERYERLNPLVNAIVATDFDSARKRAKEADIALSKGETWGPLHGLPMTIKDNIEVVGMPTTFGSPLLKDFKPWENTNIVESLLDVGAIIFGKTNLPLWASDGQSYNEVYGQTNNPWDVTKTPGGSSGGAAAAIAAGLTGLEIGNDIGGSIRIPASFCGIHGHKPSFGIVSMRGGSKALGSLYPNSIQSEYYSDTDMAVHGPLARSAADLALAMDVITGPPFHQRKAIKIQLPQARRLRLQDFRVGLWLDDPGFSPDTEVRDCLQDLADRLAGSGANLKADKPDIDLGECHRMRTALASMSMSNLESNEDFKLACIRRPELKDDDKTPEASRIRFLAAYYRDWIRLDSRRAVMRQKWEEYFRGFDVILCPVSRIAAHPHDYTDMTERRARCNGQEMDYWDVVIPWNTPSLVAYLPATVAPIGFTATGLPVGVQIVGPYLEDRTPIQFAMLIEEHVTGSFRVPPGFE